MQTFDQALFDLYVNGEISYEDAVHHADSANEVRLMIKLHDEDPDKLKRATDGISLEEIDDGTSMIR